MPGVTARSMARLTGRLVSAGLVVLVGVLLLLSTTDAVPTASLWAWFPALFVLLGLWALVGSGFRNVTGPVMVVAVAGTFLLRNLGYVTDEAIGTYWPLFVVLFGVLLFLGRSRGRSVTATGADGGFTAISVFGGGSQRVTGEFAGGEAVAVFGGPEIDLRDATVADPPAVVEVVAVFGGAEIRVPEDWDVSLDVLAIFGGADDARRRGESTGDPDLVVTGVVLFGGVELLD